MALAAVAVAALTIGLSLTSALDGVELRTVDARYDLRPGLEPREDIVIVALDAKTVREVDRRTVPRALDAQAITAIAGAEPRAIAIDFQYVGRTTPEDDEALLDALDDARPVVVATHDVDGPQLRVPAGLADPAEVGAVRGSVGVDTRGDGRIRRFFYAPVTTPTFAVVTARIAGETVRESDFDDNRQWIDFARPGGYRTLSEIDVARGEFDPEVLHDKIVLLGATDPQFKDLFSTPVSDDPVSGVEIWANSIATILGDYPLRSVPGWVDVLLCLFAAATPALAGLRLAAWRIVLVAAASLVLFAVCAQLAFNSGAVVGVTWPAIALIASAATAATIDTRIGARERERLRLLFGRFVPEPVIEQAIAGADDGLRLASTSAEVTVLFSDVRDFTGYSETHDARQVISVLNRYLDVMTTAIQNTGGTLITYMGDGILAAFGAPLPQPDHADRALRAARAMLAELEPFNASIRADGLGEGFAIGIGINTGEAMVGTVGSRRRLDYTVIGDAVNVAARLEGMTKETAHTVLVADSTRSLLTDAGELADLGSLTIRGRGAPVHAWGLGG